MTGGHCWTFDRGGRVSPKASHPAGDGRNWRGLAGVLGGTPSAVFSEMTDLVAPPQTSGSERPISGFGQF